MIWAGGAMIAVAGLLASCRREETRAIGPATHTEIRVAKRDHFGLAMQYLFDLDATRRSSDDAVYHLNRWLLSHEPQTDWQLDSLVKRLMPELQAIPEVKRLERLQFVPSDRAFLEETWWLHSISKEAMNQPLPPLLDDWIERQADLTSGDHQALREACRLFDWTVRHIYLEPLLNYPRLITQGPTFGSNESEKQPTFPSMRAEPGPGYRFYPLQNLMTGRGDALNRARVMLLLCRQRNLPAFMLGLDPGGTPRPRPWLCAVLIAKRLYLFDPQLGLPIPGKEPGSVAALDDLRSDAQWPHRLVVGSRPYAFADADLSQLVALIDGSPEYLSRRMAVLEDSLPTRHQMVLTVRPSRLARQLTQVDPFFGGSGRIRLWNLPFETAIFQRNLRKYFELHPSQAQRDMRPLSILRELPMLHEARRRHALGWYVDQGKQPGAKTLYLESRTPNEALARLPRSRSLQEQWGLEREDRESPGQFQARLQQQINLRREAKYLASYWLALAHYDSGMVDVAVNWFKERTLQAFPQGDLNAGAQYNLARCYELLGQPDQAIKLLEKTSWPQQHGDRLRARLLKQPAGR